MQQNRIAQFVVGSIRLTLHGRKTYHAWMAFLAIHQKNRCTLYPAIPGKCLQMVTPPGRHKLLHPSDHVPGVVLITDPEGIACHEGLPGD